MHLFFKLGWFKVKLEMEFSQFLKQLRYLFERQVKRKTNTKICHPLIYSPRYSKLSELGQVEGESQDLSLGLA